MALDQTKGLMTYLILGLIVFLGVHSVRIVADGWRTDTRARIGAMPWKGLYSLASAIGFGLIIWGFGLARQQPLTDNPSLRQDSVGTLERAD